MAKKTIIALACCIFAACLALAGCTGAGAGNGDDAKKAFIGTWALAEIVEDGQATSADDLETLKSLGFEIHVDLNEDGTAALVLFEESLDGTWEAESATQGTITLNDHTVSMVIEDSQLRFEQGGAALAFEKSAEQGSTSASSAGSESGEAASSDASSASSQS